MLPIHAQFVRRATESHALSALPAAPAVAIVEAAPAAATRRVVAARLIVRRSSGRPPSRGCGATIASRVGLR